MNEDIDRPATGSQQPIPRLANAQTGLQLTKPLNPFTANELTFSIQAASLTRRYDYILPCGSLFSNILSSQVFRTDLLSPPPPGLQSDDNRIASDHLPVMMVFSNPDQAPFALTSIRKTNAAVTLNWQSIAGRVYNVEGSINLTQWTVLATNLAAEGTNSAFSTNLSGTAQFFRVRRF